MSMAPLTPLRFARNDWHGGGFLPPPHDVISHVVYGGSVYATGCGRFTLFKDAESNPVQVGWEITVNSEHPHCIAWETWLDGNGLWDEVFPTRTAMVTALFEMLQADGLLQADEPS